MTELRVLILEDSLIIAMEAELLLHEIGVKEIEIVSSIDQAMAVIETGRYGLALLDVNLGESMSFGFARSVREQGIPFGFVTGYSDARDFPPDMQQVPLLVKPFDDAAMREFLGKLFPSGI